MREIEKSESKVIAIWENLKKELEQNIIVSNDSLPIVRAKNSRAKKNLLQLSLWD